MLLSNQYLEIFAGNHIFMYYLSVAMICCIGRVVLEHNPIYDILGFVKRKKMDIEEG